MKRTSLLFLLLAIPASVFAQAGPADTAQYARGILKSEQNATVTAEAAGELRLARIHPDAPIRIEFASCQALGVQRESGQWWVLPLSAAGTRIQANTTLWVLPLDASSPDRSWSIDLHGATASAAQSDSGLSVELPADGATLRPSEARPHSDPFGHRFSFDVPHGAQLADALAAFYWGTMLPSVVEKTMAARFPYSSGYVLSTLNIKSYAGSYPAVDHEFQIKGRVALGSEADLDIVRRMIELQFKLMDDDPERLHRAPTSVQPNGTREYHVRRDSMDHHQNAAMFPLTGNIEVVEEAWRYYQARKDRAWLRAHISHLEDAAAWTLASMDPYGRVWSDVYYEDQVIKDGRVTQAQAFATHSFELLAHMERLLGRQAQAARDAALAKKMAAALTAPLPMGFWDEKNQRFIDWVDRLGGVHDHIHLVANELPVFFGYATPAQAGAVRRLLEQNAAEFERFPSFLAADVAGYTKSEIGDGGPYDLSAAGRYWYWDAAFRASQKQNALLSSQLVAVAGEGANDNYYMGERYDMDHVYYVDGKNAHGAQKYYEYPNVFAAVLIDKYLGLSIPADADVLVAPHLDGYGTVEFGIPAYAVRYTYDAHGFVLKNLSAKSRRYDVDLSALGDARYRLRNTSASGAHFTVTLRPQEEARWTASTEGGLGGDERKK